MLLRSDRFYLFAGLGPILEGYILITPYRCDDVNAMAQSISEFCPALLDELSFLRFLVSRFHVARFGHPGLAFEHGRAGGCIKNPGDTPHCHHAHLCCYPGIPGTRTGLPGADDRFLWSAFPSFEVVEPGGLHGLRDVVGSCAYLYMEHYLHEPDGDQLVSGALLLSRETELEQQALRRALASAIGRPESWDWARGPDVSGALRCREQFRDWLRTEKLLALDWEAEVPRMDFHASVRTSNLWGNNRIATRFRDRWGGVLQYRSIGRLLGALPEDSSTTEGQSTPRVLDVGCGPGLYARIFCELGLDCLALDSSPEMITLTREHVGDRVRLHLGDLLYNPPAERFHAIWASALLLHFPHSQASAVLSALVALLEPMGVLYLSTRVGIGVEFRPEGRIFFLYREAELLELVDRAGLEVLRSWDGETRLGTTGDRRRKAWRHLVLLWKNQ